MFVTYFAEKEDDSVLTFLSKRMIKNQPLDFRRYIERTVEEAEPPVMQWQLDFLGLIRVFEVRNGVVNAIANSVAHQWKTRAEEILRNLSTLLDDLDIFNPVRKELYPLDQAVEKHVEQN